MKCSEGVNEISGLGGGREGGREYDFFDRQQFVSQKRKVMQKWRPETHNVWAFSCAPTFIFLFYIECPKKVTRGLN